MGLSEKAEVVLELLTHCARGGRAMLIKKGRTQLDFRVGEGWLHIRGWAKTTLISLKPDVVIFIDEDVPEDLVKLVRTHHWLANIWL